jgi:drug/metabolite transporter (DMT)-like permease
MTRSGLPRIALLALIWGSGFLWIKLADRGFSPVEVTLARLVLGAAVLSAVILVRRETVPRSLRLWVHITVAALFANAIPYLLFAVAEQTVDSSTAGIINATTPLWTVVLALAVRHQKSVTSWQAAGLIVGFAGAVLIGFAYEQNYQIITSEGATVASTVTYLLPVVAIVLGVLVLGETITATVLAGIALVLAGVALTRRRTKPATDEPPAG